jgi:pyruvate,water dikinase
LAQQLRALHLEEIVQSRPAAEALATLQALPEAQPFMDEILAFLRRHGYRCPNSAELRNPRWEEAPDQIIELLKSYLSMSEETNPITRERQLQQERQVVTARIEAGLNPFRRLVFRWLLNHVQEKIRLRDNIRSYIAKFLYPMRLLIIEIGRRWTSKGWLASPDDIFFLAIYEIDDIMKSNIPEIGGNGLAQVSQDRRLAYDYWNTIIPPAAMGPGGIPVIDPEPNSAFLQGVPASAGRVRGTARLVRSYGEASKLSSGDILVARETDPGWTPIFPLVSGLVLEVGGQLSHGAIIAREYGTPAVINVLGALHMIQDGQLIEVDGTGGRVYLY